MRNFPTVGDNVCIKGFESLPFLVVAVDRSKAYPVTTVHPFIGVAFAFKRGELSVHVPQG